MTNPRVLIDAANLRSGGGLQVAASFIDELALLKADPGYVDRYPWLRDVDVEASPEVVANLSPETAKTLRITTRSHRPGDREAWVAKPTHDVSFTVFGPAYGRPRAKHNIVGFADVTSIYDEPTTRPDNVKAKAVQTVRRNVSRALFTHAQELVVEAAHVRHRLHEVWNYPTDRIHIVPNTVNSVFKKHDSERANGLAEGAASPSSDGERGGWIYVTRSYPHKNINLLGKVGEELATRGVTDVTFLLTLRDDEWDALDEVTRKHCRNLGARRVEELPALYAAAEGSVFPSLLECFSAAPLEAIFSGLPLVASDRAFVRDICGDAAIYADPYDPKAWADAIIKIREDSGTAASLRAARGEVIAQSSSASARARSYVDIIDSACTSSGVQ